MIKKTACLLLVSTTMAMPWMTGCGNGNGNGGGGLTVEIAGCPGDVEQGGMISLTMSAENNDGDDVTANVSWTYILTSGATSFGITGQNNLATADVPEDAEVGAYVITATGELADGTSDTDDCRFNVTETDVMPPPDRELAYVGSQACSVCHSEIFGWFRNSAHPYKINKIIDDEMPTYPFSTIDGALEMVFDDDEPLDDGTPDPGPGTDNSLSTPADYSEISYVIGGFGWKARFMDLDGFIVTGSDVQYNLETEGMVSYHNNEVDKPFTCGNCHTTGWRAYTSEEGDDRNLNRQDDLPGMSGTFAEQGIQCEACHGAGSEHVLAPSSDNIVKIATPRTTEQFQSENMAYGVAAACSDCHTRNAEKDYPAYSGGPGLIQASSGLIRHHEQNDEMIGINPDDPTFEQTGPHRNLDCITCHNPHTTTRYQDISGDPPGMDTACTQCHSPAEYEITSGGMQDLACIDCHMPLLAKSALSHPAVGTGPVTGDIKTHIFRIDLTAENQFTDDNAFAYPWITGDFACKICHNGEDSFNIDFPSQLTIHNN